MGWYLRKSFKFGPLRLNLSKSGLGASAGVTGFRVGTSPKGEYLHAGRGGLYYRKNLRLPSEKDARAEETAPEADKVMQPPNPPKAKDGLVRWIKKVFGGR